MLSRGAHEQVSCSPALWQEQTAGWGPSKGARVLKPASIAPTPRDEGKWPRGSGNGSRPAHCPQLMPPTGQEIALGPLTSLGAL